MRTGENHGTHQSNNQKPHGPQKSKERQTGYTPQYNSHIDLIPRVFRRGRVYCQPLQPTRTQHQRAEGQVREDPNQHNRTSKPLIVILLLLARRHILHLLDSLVSKDCNLAVVLVVEIAFVRRDIDVNFAAGFESCRGEFLGFVVAFGTPGDVVGVAEGVNVEDVDVGWSEEEVLDELIVQLDIERWRTRGMDDV